jgi:hypothetical protein
VSDGEGGGEAVPTNTIEPSPMPELTPTPDDVPMTAQISGRVWHDVCAFSGVDGEIPERAPKGCVADAQGGWVADGMLDVDEEGIAGVLVSFAEGACPGVVTKVTSTNVEGYFAFPELGPGEYCISIDPNAEENLVLDPALLPGRWTSPFYDSNSVTIPLTAGEQREEVNFGWDYLNIPEQKANCTNVATFIKHVTIPDNSSIAPGGSFVKTWLVRNDGTCVWTPDYALVFASGELMGAPSPIPMKNAIAPGDEIELSVSFVAPSDEGVYQSFWLLQDDYGDTFGTGASADQNLSVSIVIRPSLIWKNLGAPSWNDSFDDAAAWNQFDDAYGHMYISDGRLTYISRQVYPTWFASYPTLDDFYMEAIISTGGTCTGMDNYGLMVRTKSSGDSGIYDTGYLFGFSCDGKFSIRRWDDPSTKMLVDWQASDAITPGPNVTNHLGVALDGSVLRIYANGVLLAEVTDSKYPEGRFGPYIAGLETPGFTIYVEQLAYWVIVN